jgi:hypothetical protein
MLPSMLPRLRLLATLGGAGTGGKEAVRGLETRDSAMVWLRVTGGLDSTGLGRRVELRLLQCQLQFVYMITLIHTG